MDKPKCESYCKLQGEENIEINVCCFWCSKLKECFTPCKNLKCKELKEKELIAKNNQ